MRVEMARKADRGDDPDGGAGRTQGAGEQDGQL
jgi:hypothetical protein